LEPGSPSWGEGFLERGDNNLVGCGRGIKKTAGRKRGEKRVSYSQKENWKWWMGKNWKKRREKRQ